MNEVLKEVYFGNTVLAYILALAGFVVGVLIIKVFKRIILNRLKKWAEKTETTVDDFLVRGIERTVDSASLFLFILFGSQILKLRSKIRKDF